MLDFTRGLLAPIGRQELGGFFFPLCPCCGARPHVYVHTVDHFIQYDEVGDAWSTMLMSAISRSFHAAAAISSRGYIAFGSAPTLSITIEEYDPLATTWSNKTSAPSPNRGSNGAGTVGAAGYFCYGSSTGGILRDCDEYAPAGDAWTSKTDGPTPARLNSGVIESGSAVYSAFGLAASSVVLVDCDQYTPAGDAWASKTDAPGAARYSPAAIGDAAGRIAFCGGNDSGVTTSRISTNDEYAPGSDAWTNRTSLPSPARLSASGTALAGKGYSTDGNASSGGIADHDAYDFASDTWTSLTDATYAFGQARGFVA